MLIVALVMAIIGLAALVTAVVTSNEVIGWVCIGASVIGAVLLIVDTLRLRQQRDAQSAAAADENLAFDADYPDYAASDRPAADAPLHGGDHEVQREIMREERVLHPDTGPRDPDITEEEMLEAIRHRRRHRPTHRSSE
jgi:hypothetical protein